jgi:hypothetical protein
VWLESFDCSLDMIIGDTAKGETFFGIDVIGVDSWVSRGVIKEYFVEKLAFVGVVANFYLVA